MRKVLPATGLPIGLALTLAIPLTLLLQPSVVYGDEDRASLGDWIYLSFLFVATVGPHARHRRGVTSQCESSHRPPVEDQARHSQRSRA